jgi:hypothetical protein
LFPEFAAQFFDAVCIGWVDSVPAVIADFERGAVQTYYRSPARRISHYTVFPAGAETAFSVCGSGIAGSLRRRREPRISLWLLIVRSAAGY